MTAPVVLKEMNLRRGSNRTTAEPSGNPSKSALSPGHSVPGPLSFITAILIPHLSGGWEFGGVWIGLILDPMTVIRWIAMASVGGFLQVQYVHPYRKQERKFQRERMHQAIALHAQKPKQ